jgi:N-acetyl sugar amidotransferase
MISKIIRKGEPGYQQCTVSIMDTTDPDITFDNEGVSNHVRVYRERISTKWRPEGDPVAFRALIDRIKTEGKGKPYDCALGLSGGVDSSYMAYIAKREGLRPLVIHTDCGWNSDTAVRNIEKIVKACSFDLVTAVIDWDEIADLQYAFLRAGVPNQDIPQDQAIFAAFYKTASKHHVKYVLSGGNNACESILPKAWGHRANDIKHIRAIHQKFGRRPLDSYPRMSDTRYDLIYTIFQGMRVVRPLDLLYYNQARAIATLEEEFGWQYYGGKHYESRWTRFFQGWWLVNRFGYDKRLAHLSSLIVTGQITRDEALAKMQIDHYTQGMIEEDLDLVIKKLGITRGEWEGLFLEPVHSHFDYPTTGFSRTILLYGMAIARRSGFIS